MNLTDNCAICQSSMLRKQVIKLQPCNHQLHESCYNRFFQSMSSFCPICRVDINTTLKVDRRVNKSSSARDRQLIVESSNKGDDLVALASNLNVKYTTAYNWIRSGNANYGKRGGKKPNKITESVKETILSWIETNPTITLVKIKQELQITYNVNVSETTIGNCLEGAMYSVKKLHYEPIIMNSQVNKEKR